jgi:hypothetical protein
VGRPGCPIGTAVKAPWGVLVFDSVTPTADYPMKMGKSAIGSEWLLQKSQSLRIMTFLGTGVTADATRQDEVIPE